MMHALRSHMCPIHVCGSMNFASYVGDRTCKNLWCFTNCSTTRTAACDALARCLLRQHALWCYALATSVTYQLRSMYLHFPYTTVGVVPHPAQGLHASSTDGCHTMQAHVRDADEQRTGMPALATQSC